MLELGRRPQRAFKFRRTKETRLMKFVIAAIVFVFSGCSPSTDNLTTVPPVQAKPGVERRAAEVPLVVDDRPVVADALPAFDDCLGPIGAERYSCVGARMVEFLESVGFRDMPRARLYAQMLTLIGKRVEDGELTEGEAKLAGYETYKRFLAKPVKQHELEIVAAQRQPEQTPHRAAADYLMYWAKQERIHGLRQTQSALDKNCFGLAGHRSVTPPDHGDGSNDLVCSW